MVNRIELWPVERLVPYERNARTHSEMQVAQIAASIVEFGFNAPILVDSNAGIIAGHGRLMAARKLGLAEVPVIVLDHLSETQKRAYIIADNKLTELGGWDAEALSLELKDLQGAEFDLDLLGFSDREIEALIGETALEQEARDAGEDAVPAAPAEPVTRPGDIWVIGRHRLICGDCRELSTVARLLDGAKANLVITSPPYATQREYDPAPRV
jgi:ParB-like chromosome segregation protein Spo0J